MAHTLIALNPDRERYAQVDYNSAGWRLVYDFARSYAPEELEAANNNFSRHDPDDPEVMRHWNYGFALNDQQVCPAPYPANLGERLLTVIASGEALKYCRVVQGEGVGDRSDADTVRRLRMVINFTEFLVHCGGLQVW